MQLFLRRRGHDGSKSITDFNHESKLDVLQEEFIKLQQWVESEREKVVIFEGRDAAGKGGAIRRITQHLNPREFNVVALPNQLMKKKANGTFSGMLKTSLVMVKSRFLIEVGITVPL